MSQNPNISNLFKNCSLLKQSGVIDYNGAPTDTQDKISDALATAVIQ
jgi:hypothetical protein